MIDQPLSSFVFLFEWQKRRKTNISPLVIFNTAKRVFETGFVCYKINNHAEIITKPRDSGMPNSRSLLVPRTEWKNIGKRGQNIIFTVNPILFAQTFCYSLECDGRMRIVFPSKLSSLHF